MSEHTPWDEGDAKAVFDCLKYHAAAGGEYEYRGTLAIEAFTRICAEIAKLRAEREELRELLWWVEAKLQPELNVSNYHHQQVCELNANATEAVLAIRAALAEKGE